jgi:hypothetical protein
MRTGGIDIQNLDRDRPPQQVALRAAKQDQRIDTVDRRPAADIDQKERRRGIGKEKRIECSGKELDGLLQPQAHRGQLRRADELAVGVAVEGRRQSLGAELHDVGGEAGEEARVRIEDVGEKPRPPRRCPHHEIHDKARDQRIAQLGRAIRGVQCGDGGRVIGQSKSRLRDVDDRKANAVVGRRVSNI